jgi:hypothetical protein
MCEDNTSWFGKISLLRVWFCFLKSVIRLASLFQFGLDLLSGSHGLIEFSLVYNESDEHLLVNVIKAKVFYNNNK